MKAVAILLLAIVAMASSQVNTHNNMPGPGQVNIVDRPAESVHVVEQPINQGQQGIDSGFYRPSAGNSGGNVDTGPPSYPIITNPDPGFYQPSYPEQPSIAPTFVVDPGFYRPSDPNAPTSLNPAFVDPGFYRPSDPNAPASLNPALVDPAFYRPSDPNAPASLNPAIVDPGFYRPSDPNAAASLDPTIVDPGFYRPSDPQAPSFGPTFINPDPGFYRPSAGGSGSGGQYNQQMQNKPYPPKQYNNPFARGGK